MALERILNLRYNYGMSAEEMDQAYAEALAAKIAELKGKYANTAGYEDYDDADWTRLAEMHLGSGVAHTLNAFYIGHTDVEHDPELRMWLQYTYEEILQMEAGGVLIPEEILEWAHSMQDSDVTSYDVDETETPEETTGEKAGNEYAELEEETKKLSKKSKEANENTNIKYEEFQIISKRAEEVQREQESSQNDALKEIQELNEEYADFAERLENGEQLSDSDLKRYQELNSLLNGEDGKLMADLQVTVSELEDLMNSMEGLDKDIDENIELGEDTVEVATELALYEKEHDYTNTEPNFFINVATNDVIEKVFGAQGQSIARDAFDNGSNLVKFSNTLDNTLMSTQYTALYQFATEFSTNAEAVIDETREVMGDNFNQTTEELNGTEEEENQEEEENKILTIEELIAKRQETKELIQKDIEVRGASAKVAENAAKEVEAFKEEQTELAEDKEEAVEEVDETQETEQEEVEETEAPQETENPEDVEEPQEPQETEEPQENSETQEAEQEVLNIDEAIAESELKGDTAKERLDKAVEVNGKYDQFNTETAEVLNTTTGIGAMSSVFGTTMIAHGQLLIASGMAIIMNPVLASILIAQGTLELVAGAGYIGVGNSLMATAFKGVDETVITGEQIDLTDEIIEKAMEKIEAMENGEEVSEGDVISQAQKDLMQMIADGKSLPEQAIAFTGKSNQASAEAQDGIFKTAITGMISTAIAKDAETTAKVIEKRFKDDKEEYDELVEKKEKSEEAKESVEEDPIASGNVDPDEMGEEGFSDEDQQRLDKLSDKLQRNGDRAQERLQKQLEAVEGLSEFLAEQDEVALNAVDYGHIAQMVGMNLFDQSKNNALLIHRMIISMMAIRAGKGAQLNGEKLDEVVDKTTDKNTTNASKIKDAQDKVAEITMSEALYAQESEETEETEEPAPEEVEDEVEQEAPKGAAAMVQGRGMSRVMTMVDNTNENGVGNDKPENTDNTNNTNGSNRGGSGEEEGSQNIFTLNANQGSNESKSKGAVNECRTAITQSKADSKESQKTSKDAQKDEKQLTQEGKNLLKLIAQDEKEVQKLTEESLQAVAEQERLVAEFEALQAENDTLTQEISMQEPTQPAPQPTGDNRGGAGQGGMNPPVMQDTTTQQNVVIITNNQTRMGEISTRFNTLGTTVNTNRYKMTRIQGNINKRVRKYKKVTNTRIKLQEKARKAEEAKIKRIEKTNAALDIVSNVFSIVGAIGTLMQVVGVAFQTSGTTMIINGTALLVFPTTAIGAAMIATGTTLQILGTTCETGGSALSGICTIGSALCQVAKAGVLAANGYTQEAITTLGSAIISIAASFVGAGGAASGVLQGISAGCTIVGSSAQLAANVQTVQGKEQSEWLGTVSQVAGLAGGLANTGAGFANGFANSFDAVTKIVGAAGQASTATAQILTWIKQGKGEEAGKLEEILSQIGMGLSTASSLMSLSSQFAGSVEKRKENKNTNKTNKKSTTDKNNDKINNDNKDNKVNNGQNDDKVNNDNKNVDGNDDKVNKDDKVGDNEEKTVDNEDDEKVQEEKVEDNSESSDSENTENTDNTPVIVTSDGEKLTTDQIAISVAENVEEVNNAQVSSDEAKVEEVQGYDAQQESDKQEQQETSRKEKRAEKRAEKEEAKKAAKEEKQAEKQAAKEENDKIKAEKKLARQNEREKLAGMTKEERKQALKDASAEKKLAKQEEKKAHAWDTYERVMAEKQTRQENKDARVEARNERKEARVAKKEAKANEPELTKEQKQQQKTEEKELKQQQKAEEKAQREAEKEAEKNEPKLSRKERKAQEEQQEQQQEQQAKEAFANKVAAANGLSVENPEKEINGKIFKLEIDKEGNTIFKIDDTVVSPGVMHAQMKMANAQSQNNDITFMNAQPNESVYIDGVEFIKQGDGTFKAVLGYDDNLNEITTVNSFNEKKMAKIDALSGSETYEWGMKQVNKYNRAVMFEQGQEIYSQISQAASGAYNIAMKIMQMTAQEEQQPQQKVVNIADMRKARALAKKIKQRRNANIANHNSRSMYRPY